MRSLLVRLLAASALVSVCAVAATAWLAVRTTTRAIQQEQAQALTIDSSIYDTLLGWAATHHDWAGAAPLVRSLAGRTGHRIALVTRDGSPLIDSGGGTLPARASATVDPLQDLAGGVDPRAVGPFALTTAERTELHVRASAVLTCLQTTPATIVPAPAAADQRIIRDVRIVTGPSGRPAVVTPGSDLTGDLACVRPRLWLNEPAATERRALGRLGALVTECLAPHHVPAVTVTLQWTWRWQDPASVRAGQGQDAAVERCLAGARRELLAPYVAPPARLFLTTPGAPAAETGLDLSPAGQARIAGVSALVLLVTLGVGALVARRLARPLRELTAAAQRMRDGDGAARVRVKGGDEIAKLGAVFNDMAARRQEIEQLRRDMVGDIAHEMRTPVTNIRGWLEAAEDGVVVLDRKLAASLLEEALLLQHVIDDLRDLSAADAGELRLHPSPVDLPELLTQVAAAYRTATVAVAVDAPPSLLLTADPIRLRQAIGNLTGNAVRHSPPGATVTLTARRSGAEVVVDVADQGPGLTAEELPMVFERFWRAEKSRSRQTGGSGLGLAITRKLVETHGGTVDATSIPGAGATFTVRLPADPHVDVLTH